MRPQTRLRGAMEKTKLENLTRRPRKPSTRPAGSGKGSLGKSTPAKAEGRPRGDQVPLAAAIFLKGWPQFRLKPIISNPRHRRHVTLRALLTARPARSGPREKGELVRSTPPQNTRNCPWTLPTGCQTGERSSTGFHPFPRTEPRPPRGPVPSRPDTSARGERARVPSRPAPTAPGALPRDAGLEQRGRRRARALPGRRAASPAAPGPAAGGAGRGSPRGGKARARAPELPGAREAAHARGDHTGRAETIRGAGRATRLSKGGACAQNPDGKREEPRGRRVRTGQASLAPEAGRAPPDPRRLAPLAAPSRASPAPQAGGKGGNRAAPRARGGGGAARQDRRPEEAAAATRKRLEREKDTG